MFNPVTDGAIRFGFASPFLDCVVSAAGFISPPGRHTELHGGRSRVGTVPKVRAEFNLDCEHFGARGIVVSRISDPDFERVGHMSEH